MKRFVIPFLCFLLFITACKKDPVVKQEQKSPLELLTNSSSKSWKVRDGKAKQNGLEVNLIASQNPCITDNIIKLYSDFTYEFSEGASKCDPNDPELILKASWQLSSDAKTVTIDKFIFLGRSIDKPVFILTDLTESTFSGTTSLTFDNETVQIEVTFEKVP